MRFVIPETFTMPVTVRVGTASGDVVRHARIRQREDTIVVDSVSSEPTMVVFDDGNHILKSLAFDEPTAWLATQLRRDPDSWNREWVLGQLVRRPTDPGAASAVANALTGADSWYTRQVAATAIDTFPAAVAIPALTTAIRDTSAQVRAAAAAALAKVGGPQALALARNAWQHDSSHAVRASALTSLVRLDSAGRRALIGEGLRTPSYRDVIQDAALVAIAQTNDTSFVADLERIVGEQPLVARILAVLASRGDQHAMNVLVAAARDDRSWVRAWAKPQLDALQGRQRR
jgi:hypothetical protein